MEPHPRSFTKGYKRQALELLTSSGRSIGLPGNSACAARCCGGRQPRQGFLKIHFVLRAEYLSNAGSNGWCRHGVRAIMARPVPCAHHRQPSRPADRTEPDRAQLDSPGSRPGLARRYHLHADRRGVAVSGGRHGSVQPKDRRLGHAGSPAGRSRIRSTDDGHQPAAAVLD